MNKPYEQIRTTKLTKKLAKKIKSKNGHESYSTLIDTAVKSNLEYIHSPVSGYEDLRELLDYLRKVDSIHIDTNETAIQTRLIDDDLTKRINFRPSFNEGDQFDDINDAIELSFSEIVRLCLIAELYRESKNTRLLDSPEDRILRSSWLRIQKEIELTLPRLINEMYLHLVIAQEYTKECLLQDSLKSDYLREHYVNSFQDSEGYRQLVESENGRGPEVVRALEDLLDTVAETSDRTHSMGAMDI